jgi:hypothetical protein
MNTENGIRSCQEGIKMIFEHKHGEIIHDPMDQKLVKGSRWYKNKQGLLFRRRVENMTEVHVEFLHRLVAGANARQKVVFVNDNPFDVRLENLAVSDMTGRRGGGGDIQGVYYDKSNGRYKAVVLDGGKRVTVGYYKSPEEAQSARDEQLSVMGSVS